MYKLEGNKLNIYKDIDQNKRRSVYIILFFLIFTIGLLLIFSKALNWGNSIVIGGTIGALAYAIITYYSGASMALAVNRAQEVKKKDNPRLYRIVENIAITDGLPTPKVYVMDDPAANAFATGRDPEHSFVCVTSGLLDMMNDKELEGVIAHEMSHIKNYDIRVNMIAFALTVIISFVADIVIRSMWFGNERENENNPYLFLIAIVAAILAPFVAMFIQLAISRQREYLADASGALATRYPEGLASALEKIKNSSSATRVQNTSTAHLFFANPLRKHGITSLFETHPPIDERIARLRKMD